MDSYTQKTMLWLDECYKKSDEDGIYFAHQPIYGFRKGHSEPQLYGRYIRTFQIIKTLSHIKFKTLLDVGGSEGYKAYLIHRLLGASVLNSDLSIEACKRAEEIFNIASVPADIHALPFKNGEFDVVLCSETLEHITDVNKAMKELLRVANKAIIITVPHEKRSCIEQNIRLGEYHSHIHDFKLNSFDYLIDQGCRITKKKMLNPILRVVSLLLETPTEHKKYNPIIVFIFNICASICNYLFDKKSEAFLLGLDEYICRILPFHEAILFCILKDDACFCESVCRKITAEDIINQVVPYYYLKKNA